jgi:hypothetical protein
VNEENLKNFNLTILLATISLIFWTAVGEKVSNPVKAISLFAKLSPAETRDRLSPLVVVLVVIVTLSLVKWSKLLLLGSNYLSIFVSTVIFFVSISSYLIDDDVEWAGLGVRVATVCTALSALLIIFVKKIKLNFSANYKHKYFWDVIFVGVFLVVYLPSMSQFSGGIIDLFASSTVFNELLLPVTSITPLGNFATQYTSMLGWPLLLIKDFSPANIMTGVLIWLFVLSVIQILTISVIGKAVLRSLPFSVLLLLSSSIVLMKGSKSTEITGSIVASFFSIPSRTFLPSLLCLILVTALLSESKKLIFYILLGALLPITALNNLEFGVPALVAAILVVILNFNTKLVDLQRVLTIVASAITTLAIISLVFFLRSAPLSFELWTAMARAQGSGGYMNVPMKPIDTFLFVFAIHAAAVVLGIVNLTKTTNLLLLRSATVSTFAGTWGILAMPYYTGRSWPSHIHVFFIPLTLCIFGIAGIFHHNNELMFRQVSIIDRLKRLPLLITIALPIATLLIAPNPITEWRRATGGGFEWSLESQSKTKSLIDVRTAIDRYGIEISKSVYFGDQYASTIDLITGVRNGLGLNTVEYSLVSPELRDVACQRIKDLKPEIVIAQNDDTRMNFLGPTLLDSSCPGMSVLHAPDDIGVTIFSYATPKS